jgi:hypothetical protein
LEGVTRLLNLFLAFQKCRKWSFQLSTTIGLGCNDYNLTIYGLLIR